MKLSMIRPVTLRKGGFTDKSVPVKERVYSAAITRADGEWTHNRYVISTDPEGEIISIKDTITSPNGREVYNVTPEAGNNDMLEAVAVNPANSYVFHLVRTDSDDFVFLD
jgi:hypothetical protein